MKKILLPVLVIISIFMMAVYSPKLSQGLKGKARFPQEFVQGEVVKVIKEDLMKDPVVKGKFRGSQTLEVKILEGKYKNQEFVVYNSLSALHNVYADQGLKAIFTVKEEGTKPTVWLYNLKRDRSIYVLGAIFIGAVILLGRMKGVKSLLALAFTGSVIIYILLPLLFKGVDPISTSILLSSIIIVVSFLLIGGYDRKTYSAIIGTISGITIAGLISFGFGKIMRLSGLNLSEGQQLLYITRDFRLQIEGLLFVSILIASLGAVMDVAMSISSSVNEIYQHKKSLTSKELFHSAMEIGKDIVGTMINTLILAFAGGSLPLMMMIWGYGMVYQQFINIPAIAIEIVNALAGSIGIIATVPVTAVVSILLIKKKRGGIVVRSTKFFVLGALLSLALVGCGKKEEAPKTATNTEVKEYSENKLNLEKKVITKGEAGAEEVTLSFAATSDVHGRIYPYEYGIDSEDKSAGFAKTYTIVKSLREQNPNLILMDIGDTVQDNSAELFNNLETHPMVEAMNTMNYDAWILGNHEFNFEKDFLLRNVKNFKGSVISVNIENEDDGSKFVLPYQIYEIEGVRVALMGGIPPHVPMWEASAPEHFKGLTFEDPMTAVKETLDELEGKYDVLVGAFHLGRKDEYGKTGVFDLAEAYPQFDLIFAGHEHARYVTDVNGTTVLEPGAYGWGVSNGEIKVAKKDGKWQVQNIVAKNIETKDVDADAAMLDQFKNVHDESRADANKVVGKVNAKFIEKTDYITGEDKVTTMPTSQLEDNAIIELINEVQNHYAKSDVSAAAVFNFDSNLNAGDFKKKDVAFIYKYTNTLMGVNMTGANLLKYMEWSMDYYNTTEPGDVTISFNPKVRGYNYDMFDGVNYKVDISKPAGERIVDATIKGEAIDPAKVYKVAVNNYRFGTLLNLGLVTTEDKYYDSYEELQDGGRIRDLIVRYVQENLNGELTPKVDNNWSIVGFDENVPGRAEIIEKIRTGEIRIPMSEDGRTLNVQSVNINSL